VSGKNSLPLITVQGLRLTTLSPHGSRLFMLLQSFPQNGDEISTCGNRLLMNFTDALKSTKNGRMLPEKVFEKKS
jgi:hypothetical protein